MSAPALLAIAIVAILLAAAAVLGGWLIGLRILTWRERRKERDAEGDGEP